RLGLDIIEEAKKQNNQDDLRHALEHVEVIHPSDIPRFESLGAIPSIQPIHISLMPRTSHTLRVQEEKYPYLYPSKSFLDTGANLAFGTDFPISPLNPMLGIYRATTRMDYSDKEKWNEHEKV